MIEVLFPDGSRLAAATYAGIERALREDAWNPFDKGKFRAEMARRAKNWSGTVVDQELVSKQFIEQLEEAGLLLIVKENR